MKKKRWFVAAAMGLLLIVFASALLMGRRPFAALRLEEIAHATVRLIPPDAEVTLDDEQIAELAALLQSTVIYRQDMAYTEYDGQGVLFTLVMADGRRITINACNPFLVIDGIGYRTKYAPCEALSAFANGLLRSR